MVNSKPDFLGPYRVVRLLGRGGMGAVYEAVHEHTHERVAVKVVSEELAHEQRFQRRFDAEIETLIRLKHPNIVRLIGTGVHQSLPFYSMEYIDGVNLHQKLKLERTLGWEMVLNWAIDIASALKQAHDFGIIHRDLKPANIMVTPENTIKIVDFGISRLFGNTGATLPGSMVGTADFMPPEQAEGSVATPRSDLYALGAICYTCMSGRPPFLGKNIPEILFNVRYGAYTPLNQLVPDSPKEFCELIDDMVSREPSKRPATAYSVMNRLQSLRAGLKHRDAQQAEPRSDRPESKEDKTQSPSPAYDSSNEQIQTSVQLRSLPSVSNLSNSPYHDATRIDPPKQAQEANPSNAHTLPETRVNSPRPIRSGRHIAQESTDEQVDGDSMLSPISDSEIPLKQGSRFTEVSDRERSRATILDDQDPIVVERQWWSEILLLVGGLVACAGAFYYFSRPVDPSRLFDRILAAMTSGDESRLLEMEDQIKSFQAKYPDDPRIDRIEFAAEEVEYLKRLRYLQRSISNKHQGQEAMVSSLREIVRGRGVSLERSQQLLSAFLDAYPDDLLTDQERSWMKFARRLQSELESKQDPESDKIKLSQLESIYERILATESSTDRQRAFRGLVDLYGNESWAAPIVGKATAALGDVIPQP